MGTGRRELVRLGQREIDILSHLLQPPVGESEKYIFRLGYISCSKKVVSSPQETYSLLHLECIQWTFIIESERRQLVDKRRSRPHSSCCDFSGCTWTWNLRKKSPLPEAMRFLNYFAGDVAFRYFMRMGGREAKMLPQWCRSLFTDHD